ncbi:MAG: hypothetical protein KatS3mg111_2246 [Pirellulaceae bacterium]|nr:MAG: hypothetical protein KatS3mg111_2246 [Pirellulaceae bacterium]
MHQPLVCGRPDGESSSPAVAIPAAGGDGATAEKAGKGKPNRLDGR